jgi:hypothetical protein
MYAKNPKLLEAIVLVSVFCYDLAHAINTVYSTHAINLLLRIFL